MLLISVALVRHSIEVPLLHHHVLAWVVRAEDHESFQASSGREDPLVS
jgi:hypothetical protein